MGKLLNSLKQAWKESREWDGQIMDQVPGPFKVPFLKSKCEELAADLLADAQVSASLANKAEYISVFIEHYDSMISDFEKLMSLEGKVSFKSGSPSYDYHKLKQDFQWHMRDAIEREFDYILREAKTSYRNNRARVETMCRSFESSIKAYRPRFDEETTSFSENIIQKLFLQCGIASPVLQKNVGDLPSMVQDFDLLDGREFEYFCANILTRNGFLNVEVTQGSGDQGVDILAEKDDIKYAIQCKCYSSDLGNTPIQEINAGKIIYRCQVGAVMTNRHFTQGAKEAAAATGTLLWDRDKLISMMGSAQAP